ncbi:MAG: flagellar biosynthetic protein FliO [Candidatus Tectomicrobia bacterium]|uniref:Flagellar biosynthetic protein FliO n=1 Tax=Tectimicrobiota bacterium TaxID=2528274 RepID=A0A932I433_UNCTE|nr:flagellar biosynthetic protein FliO [Candidatus Tectomicrobia bacterium]
MERIVGKLARGSDAARGVILLLALLSLLLGAWPAQGAPVLQKVFVYAGEDRIRLVAVFDQALSSPAPEPLAEGDGVAFFLRGARGGRELRHFVVGQGGYRRVEAEEEPDGLRLTVRAGQAIAHLKNRMGVTASGNAFTLTLPSLAGDSLRPAAGREAGRESDIVTPAPAAPRGKTEPLTPESVLRRSLSPGAPKTEIPAAPVPAPRAPAAPPMVPAKPASPSAFGPGEAEAVPRVQAPLTPADLGAGAPSLAGLMARMGGLLGGLLILLAGGLAAFKKWGGSAAKRLGAGAKVVRTLHRVYLAPKQSIAVVEVAGEILVVGISGQSISMLTKIEDGDALAKLRDGGEASFVEQLSRLMGGKEKAPALPEALEKNPAASLAAIKAYAENLAAKENGRPGGRANGHSNGRSASNGHAAPAKALPARPAPDGLPPLPDAGAGKAVVRLRERLGRAPQWTGAAS